MTPASNHPALQSIWKGHAPGPIEFLALLNQIPDPTILVNRQNKSIALANPAVLQMTAFSLDELVGHPVDFLIEDFMLEKLLPGEESSGQLTRRMRPPISVMVRANVVDLDSQWITLNLIPIAQHPQSLIEKQEEIYRNTLDLARLTSCNSLAKAFEVALEKTSSLMESNLVCIYQAESDFPRLKKTASLDREGIFPDSLPSSDLIRLSSLTTWVPGKQVVTEVHRSSRLANLGSVMTIPLGEDGVFGLLVVGFRGLQPADQHVRLMEILGTHISAAIQHFILIENLQKENRGIQNRIMIREGVFENVRQGILILNCDFRIAEINPAAELMLGYADVEVRGQQVDNVLIGPDGLLPALENAVQGIATHDLGNVTIHRRDGMSFPSHIQIIPVQKQGSTLSIQIFVEDVTEHEQIRVRTQQLEHRALIGELTAIFAHEVRNPINNLSTGLQLLATRLAGDDVNLELIGRMQGDCLRLNHLMESILSFSRQSDNKFEPVDLKNMLQRILDRWRPRLARVKVGLYFQATESLPKTHGDPRALEQVFTNLISNAIDAMSETGGTLAIRIAQSNVIPNRPQIEVTISDSGPGIPDEIRERVFEPFVTSKSKGTGLGLAITKSIVTAHRGSISLNSFPGGTIFHVYLPALSSGE